MKIAPKSKNIKHYERPLCDEHCTQKDWNKHFDRPLFFASCNVRVDEGRGRSTRTYFGLYLKTLNFSQ